MRIAVRIDQLGCKEYIFKLEIFFIEVEIWHENWCY